MAEEMPQVVKIRLTVVGIIIYLVLAVFSVRLVYLQLLKGALFKTKSLQNQTRSLRIPSYRSIIYDRNKELKLAYNERSLAVTMIQSNTPEDAKEKEAMFQRVMEILQITPTEFSNIVADQYIDPYTPIVLKSQVSPDVIARFAERLEEFPGIFWENRPKRVYPYGEAGFHVVGYAGIINKEEFSLKGGEEEYYLGSTVGKLGIERIYDGTIRGNSGILLRSVDVKGRVLQQNVSREPIQGEHIVLTIDARLQAKAQELLKDFVGSAIVTHVATGEILAMLSTPSVDPTVFSPNSLKQTGRFYDLSTNTLKPFLNRAIQGSYAPASTFKIVSAAAYLKNGVDPTKKVTCTGYYQIGNRVFRCTAVHGSVDMRAAIAHSCNSYFYHFSQSVGRKPIIEMAQEFGITHASEIDLPDEKKGFLPQDVWFRRVHKRPWSNGDTANIAIGQGDVLTTPMDINIYTAAIANGGTIYKPHVLKERMSVRDKTTTWEYATTPLRELSLSSDDITIIQEGMKRVVAPRGTAWYIDNAWLVVPLAGKTGTAQIGGSTRDNGLFTAYGPYGEENKNNAIAITVVLEKTRTGNAVTIARDLFNYYFGTLYPELKPTKLTVREKL